MKGKIFLLLFLFSVTEFPPYACTAFILDHGEKKLLAKNLDWPVAEGYLFINRKGEQKLSLPLETSPLVKWESCYGSVTFNQFGKEFPLGGINERGLVIEELSYSPSIYPRDSDSYLNEFQWIQYQLDHSKSVAEVIESLNTISVAPFLFKVHYLVCDAQGEKAVIEFIEGKVKIYTAADIVVPVLSNNSYQNAVNYLGHYQEFGGTRLVSDRPDSQERFVRAATLINKVQTSDNRNVINTAFAILDSVRQHDTQWRIVYDITDMNVYYRTRQNSEITQISLNKLNFQAAPRIHYLNSPQSTDRLAEFENYTIEKNNLLLKTVFGYLIRGGEIDENAGKAKLNILTGYANL